LFGVAGYVFLWNVHHNLGLSVGIKERTLFDHAPIVLVNTGSKPQIFLGMGE
jgi:hypothetical protein